MSVGSLPPPKRNERNTKFSSVKEVRAGLRRSRRLIKRSGHWQWLFRHRGSHLGCQNAPVDVGTQAGRPSMYVPMTRSRELKAQWYEAVVRIPRHTEQNIAGLLSHQVKPDDLFSLALQPCRKRRGTEIPASQKAPREVNSLNDMIDIYLLLQLSVSLTGLHRNF
jgi:hypothetical protein